MQLTTSVKDDGYEYGFSRGFQAGIQFGEAYIVRRMIVRRFGKQDSVIDSRICALQIQHFETLCAALSDFSTLADLTAWLDQHAPIAN